MPPEGFEVAYHSPADADVPALMKTSAALVIPAVGPKLASALFEGTSLKLVQVTGAGVDRLDQRTLPLDGRIVEPAIGAGVAAYIIDTGVRPDHVEYVGRVDAGYTAFGDDGWGTDDCNGHGSHVAGTVAGATIGVAPSRSNVMMRNTQAQATKNTTGNM